MAARRLRPRTTGIAVIRRAPVAVLMYHRVATPSTDVHELCVSPQHFAAQVAHLASREQTIPLSDVRSRSRRRRVAVTFDDGYADNVLAALPVLESRSLPATFFVTTGLVGTTNRRWWDELEHLVVHGEPHGRHLELRIDGDFLLVDAGSAAARERAHWAIYHRLRPLRSELIEGVLNQLRAQISASTESIAARFMSADELRRASASPVATIGAHGVTHQLLSSLTLEEQHEEIVAGRELLQTITRGDVATFAYPFGGPETFDERTVELVEQAGFELACAGWPGLVRPGVDRFRLPRLVVKNWDATTFAAKLEEWFARY